jgi:hypothetical protein
VTCRHLAPILLVVDVGGFCKGGLCLPDCRISATWLWFEAREAEDADLLRSQTPVSLASPASVSSLLCRYSTCLRMGSKFRR